MMRIRQMNYDIIVLCIFIEYIQHVEWTRIK
jgi:hypothetical protein